MDVRGRTAALLTGAAGGIGAAAGPASVLSRLQGDRRVVARMNTATSPIATTVIAAASRHIQAG